MLKKFLLAIATLIVTMGIAFAGVEVNKADQAALDGVKGIGPAMSKAIIAERKKNGDFKDWADLQKRVKGIGDKSSDKLSAAGLTVNGQAKPGASASASASAKGSKEAASASAKNDGKKMKAKEEKGDKASASAASSAPAPQSASASASAKK